MGSLVHRHELAKPKNIEFAIGVKHWDVNIVSDCVGDRSEDRLRSFGRHVVVEMRRKKFHSMELSQKVSENIRPDFCCKKIGVVGCRKKVITNVSQNLDEVDDKGRRTFLG